MMTERKYPVKLAASQRETLLRCEDISDSLKSQIRDSAIRKSPLNLKKGQLETLENQLFQTLYDPPEDVTVARIERLCVKISSLINDLDDDVNNRAATRQPFQKDARQVLQFKIRLCGSSPRIWRRFQMEDATLGDLHVVIQLVMGWEYAHLHQFEVNGSLYQPKMTDDLMFGVPLLDEDDFLLSQIVPKRLDGKGMFKFLYTYDMGDNWEHEVVFEGYQPHVSQVDYPTCLGGENACPPEDIGGIWGFYECLQAIADPDHSEYGHFADWIGEFDSIHFEMDEVNESLRTNLARVER